MGYQLLVPKDEFLSRYVLKVILGGTHAYLMGLELLLMTRLLQSLEHHMEQIPYYHQNLQSLLDLIHQPPELMDTSEDLFSKYSSYIGLNKLSNSSLNGVFMDSANESSCMIH
ncbi:hypothetical protein Tco_0424528 [Tanacetum coccineum]